MNSQNAAASRATDPHEAHLGRRERQVLLALLESAGRVVTRTELAERAGIADLNDRRCDSVLVSIRRILPPNSLMTVRKRGWVLTPAGAVAAREALVEQPPPVKRRTIPRELSDETTR